MQHKDRLILLVEDTEDDIELTLLALEHGTLAAEVVVARDGVEALTYLFGAGEAAVPPPPLPRVVLLDLKLPRGQWPGGAPTHPRRPAHPPAARGHPDLVG